MDSYNIYVPENEIENLSIQRKGIINYDNVYWICG